MCPDPMTQDSQRGGRNRRVVLCGVNGTHLSFIPLPQCTLNCSEHLTTGSSLGETQVSVFSYAQQVMAIGLPGRQNQAVLRP